MYTRAFLASLLVLACASAAHAKVTSVGPALIDLPAGPAVGGLPSGPWSLELPFTLDLTQPVNSVTWPGANWNVVISDSILGVFHTVTIEGLHLVAPHGEGGIGPMATLGVLFPPTAGPAGDAYGTIQHHLPGPGGGDDWRLVLTVDPGGTTASGTVYAWHTDAAVPEPATLSLLVLGAAALLHRRRMNPR